MTAAPSNGPAVGSAVGVAKVAAWRVGATLEYYRAQTDAGMKWCIACKDWHPREDFPLDRTRGDGRAAVCRSRRNANQRAGYIPTPRPAPGRRFVSARDGDKRQARRRVNYLVDIGLLASPTDLPCKDCGHAWSPGERRHEYDHYLGYAAEHHEDVEAVCPRCHHAREGKRSA